MARLVREPAMSFVRVRALSIGRSYQHRPSTQPPHPASHRQAALAVNAEPGSGKTAALGLITTLTHPGHRWRVPIDSSSACRVMSPEPSR